MRGTDLLRLTLRCRDIDRHLASMAGLTVDEMHCLNVLHADQPYCVKKLSELLGARATRTSKILKSLERGGFVTRALHPSDRRKELVTLTDRGRQTVEHILHLSGEVGTELFQKALAEEVEETPQC